MAARLWLYTASVYLLYGLLEQEASPFGEVGSVASRMLTTSLAGGAARAHAGGDGHVAEHSRHQLAQPQPQRGVAGHGCAFEIRVRLNSLAQLDELTAALEQLPQVVSVRRDSIEMMLEESESSFWPDGVADPAQGQRPYL